MYVSLMIVLWVVVEIFVLSVANYLKNIFCDDDDCTVFERIQ